MKILELLLFRRNNKSSQVVKYLKKVVFCEGFGHFFYVSQEVLFFILLKKACVQLNVSSVPRLKACLTKSITAHKLDFLATCWPQCSQSLTWRWMADLSKQFTSWESGVEKPDKKALNQSTQNIKCWYFSLHFFFKFNFDVEQFFYRGSYEPVEALVQVQILVDYFLAWLQIYLDGWLI